MTLTLASASIRGQVLDSLVVALRTIRRVDGYRWTVAHTSVTTDPVNILGVELARRPFFQVEPSPTGTREFEPANALTEKFHVQLTAIAEAEGTDPNRKIATGEALAADVERALAADLERGMGGLVSDTRVLVPEILVALGGDNTVVLIQQVVCTIHRDHGVPV